ncbi:MAG: transcriptional regulator [Gammaproteobacteria bacterium]|nr:MAG: transcriptional regulator [Gammaproteobacteria bacterium]
MDRVAQLRKKQQEFDKVKQELEQLKKSKTVQKELAFLTDLEALLKKHGKTLNDLPKQGRTLKAAPARTRKKRKLKTYINPHTGEKIQTRGGNHKILKEWKAEHGSEEVESWAR